MQQFTKLLGLVLLCCAVCAVGASTASAQCEPTTDCNLNGVLDSCDITFGTSDDCNANGIPDSCDIASGTSTDCNFNQIPDSCEPPAAFTLLPPGGFASAESVSIRGNVAAVGSPTDPTGGADAGAVHVFRRVGTTWIEEGTVLYAADATAGDQFGTSVSIDGNFLAIGAPGVDTGGLTESGAVYIFRRNPTSGWIQTAKLNVSPGIDQESFGTSVALQGTQLIVGAPQTAAGGAGRAVIFSFNGLAWSIDAILEPTPQNAGANFGNSVAIGLTHAFVGAWGNPAGATPVAGDVSVYELSGTWGFTNTLTAPLPQSGALFGIEIAGNDTTLAVGAPGQDSGAGATHIFEKIGGVWSHSLELASPLAPPGVSFGTDLDLAESGDRLIVGEQETTTPSTVPGHAHVYRNLVTGWALESSVTAGSIGDEFGAAVSVDGVYAIVASPAVPEARVFWVAPDVDCNGNGIDDLCDITSGLATDCNGNDIPDSCDLAAGTSADCDGNLVPDECQLALDPTLDCNGNGVLDSCDIASGTSLDCTLNGVPDDCDIANGTETDCLGDGIPDSCQGIVDSTLPVFVDFPADLTVSPDSGICAAQVMWPEPTVTDDCGVATVTASQQQGGLFPVGTTLVTYTATDVSGNSAQMSFTIEVIDDLGPEIFDLPADFVVPTTPGICSAVISWTAPTAGDGCGLVSLTSNVPNNSTRPAGDTVVTYTAIDVFGNTSTASFTVTGRRPGPAGDRRRAGRSDPLRGGRLLRCDRDLVRAGGRRQLREPDSHHRLRTRVVLPGRRDGRDLHRDRRERQRDHRHVHDHGRRRPRAQPGRNPGRLHGDVEPRRVPGAGLLGRPHRHRELHGDEPHERPRPRRHSSLRSLPGDLHRDRQRRELDLGVVHDHRGGRGRPGRHRHPRRHFPDSRIRKLRRDRDVDRTDRHRQLRGRLADREPGARLRVPLGNDDGHLHCDRPERKCDRRQLRRDRHRYGSADDPRPARLHSGRDRPRQLFGDRHLDRAARRRQLRRRECDLDPRAGKQFPPGDTIVTYTVTDTAGNATNGAFAVSVTDTEAPTIAGLPGTITFEAAANACDAVVTWNAPTITDNCAIASAGASHFSGSVFPVGTTVVTFDASDDAGNLATETLTVIVEDVTSPSIGPIPADFDLPNDAGLCSRVVTWLPPTVSDSCGIATVVSSHDPGATFPPGTTTVSYTATDVNGNAASASFTVTITDTEVPALTIPADVTAPADNGVCTADLVIPAASATDNCSIASLVNDFTGTGDASGSYPLGTTIVTWSAFDVNGNVTQLTQSVTVTLPAGADCNGNGVPDACDVLQGTSSDCNENGIPDECDITAGTSADLDQNGTPDECDTTFVRGDANDDGNLNIADAIFSLQNLFVGGPSPTCLDAGDVNDDGLLDISDVIFSINYIFSGGQAPPAPVPELWGRRDRHRCVRLRVHGAVSVTAR